MSQHPVIGFRVDPEIVKEFEEVAKGKGYKKQEIIALLMIKFVENPEIIL